MFPLPVSSAPPQACAQRKPASDDLLIVVTDAFGLSPDYTPRDLVRLDSYFSARVVYSETVRARSLLVGPLQEMVRAMQAAGLHPLILSGYRSYAQQLAAHQKWQQQNPGRAEVVSALPGHSEHQLGLALDFGSPELGDIIGDSEVVFHTDFDKTHEGEWLAAHAHEYGFTLSFPPEAFTWTGAAYEPWHFRYVGVELATYLHDSNQFLAKFLLQARPGLPCVP